MAAVAGMAVLAARMEEAVIRAALAGMALVRVGITLALAGMVMAARMEEAVIRAALAGMALVRVGITLALAGMVMAVTGRAVTGTVGVAAGIMVVTVVVGESAPELVSVLALDYSEEH
jgi:hypothetical protein